MANRNAYSIVAMLFQATVLADGPSTIPSSVPSGLPSWDRALPSLQLQDVRIEAKSFADAWRLIGQDYLLRTVAMYREEQVAALQHPFTFAKQSCTGHDILDALVAGYPEMTWTADERTGIIWFHSRSDSYAAILPDRIMVLGDQQDLPLQDGVLEPLGEATDLHLRVKPWGTLFRTTFNCPVDIPGGVWTLRDVLNLCCTGAPGISLRAVSDPRRGFVALEAVSLFPFPDRVGHGVRPGALLLWREEVGPIEAPVPTVAELRVRLADQDPAIRRAAMRYYMVTDYAYGGPAIISGQMPPEQLVAACLAETALRVTTLEGRHSEAASKLKSALTDEFIEKGDPALVVLGCMELARLTKDNTPLEKLSRRQFAPGQLDGIVPDIYRIARLSPTVREHFARKGMASLTAGAPELADLPTKAGPKLVFSVVEPSGPEQASKPSP